jgi:hypothetical protein
VKEAVGVAARRGGGSVRKGRELASGELGR